MKKETSFQFRKLVQHMAPVMKVYIVHNDRCNPHGARLYAKWIIVSIVTILVGLATLPVSKALLYLPITSGLHASLIGITPGLLHGINRSEQGDDLPLGKVRNEHPYRILLPFELSMHQYPYKILW